jgi:membrane protease YdiL (CAAX protease family)
MVTGSSPGGMLLMLYSFVIPAMAVIAVTRLLHDRPAGTLFGPRPWRTVSDALRVALPILGLSLVLLPFALADGQTLRHLSPGHALAYLPAALPAILVQTGAEELVFRGYLQQCLAARFRSPIAWMVLPSMLFAAGHYDPATFGADAPLVVIWAGVFGIAAADLTARTGGIGAAIGLHFASNASAFLLVGLAGSLDGLAIWTRSIDAGQGIAPLLAVDLLFQLVAWLLARLALRV